MHKVDGGLGSRLTLGGVICLAYYVTKGTTDLPTRASGLVGEETQYIDTPREWQLRRRGDFGPGMPSPPGPSLKEHDVLLQPSASPAPAVEGTSYNVMRFAISREAVRVPHERHEGRAG
ncbi:hypothetical protein MAPG_11031 [Magnaporthiopsis poae ATCC 64411]|uniref:Uncharacterized protein n=1 Tax=Magnaporthiopsis poae (strain ATCC 64411 / 73-15) TaxID=644358 RepID=A0A0C4EE66_MAGP6|nr:hypothetical protein MAPG_11031 [Magnaporthiopsis poae ATCC 64411]